MSSRHRGPVKGTVVLVLPTEPRYPADNNSLQIVAEAAAFDAQGFQVAVVFDRPSPVGTRDHPALRHRLEEITQVKDPVNSKPVEGKGPMIIRRGEHNSSETLLQALRRVETSTKVVAVVASFHPGVADRHKLAETIRLAYEHDAQHPVLAECTALDPYLADRLGTYDTQPAFLGPFDAIIAPRGTAVPSTLAKQLREAALGAPTRLAVLDDNGKPRVAAIPHIKSQRNVMHPSEVGEAEQLQLEEALLGACGLGHHFSPEVSGGEITRGADRASRNAGDGAPYSLATTLAPAAEYGGASL